MSDISVFSTGTMRSGGSLFQNIMSVHSEVIIFSGFVNFFRFYDGKYGKINLKSSRKILEHLKLRLSVRRGYDLDIESIYIKLKNLDKVSYADCYRLIMEHLRDIANKKIYGEYVTMGWRKIPKYLKYFPNGKVIHIIRDPRAVLTSFGKMSIMPDGYYLNCIFNWIDSFKYSEIYKKSLSKNRYMLLRFEDIHENPNKTINKICKFLNIEFEDSMVSPNSWDNLFDKNFVDANISVYNNKKVYGFDIQRTKNWMGKIKKHEKFICDILLSDIETDLYDFSKKNSYNSDDIRKNLKKISNFKIFYKSLNNYLITKKGNDKHVIDPTKPENWDSNDSKTGKFIDTDAYKSYIDKYDEIMNYL
tara:strand:- start:804 stop:1886 length:1083 start_codon:yes stop_codon:yes gene_type:complete